MSSSSYWVCNIRLNPIIVGNIIKKNIIKNNISGIMSYCNWLEYRKINEISIQLSYLHEWQDNLYCIPWQNNIVVEGQFLKKINRFENSPKKFFITDLLDVIVFWLEYLLDLVASNFQM